MTKLEKGKEILNQLRPNGAEGVLNGMGKFAPDMANFILEFIFGELYGRPGLDLKTKQIVTLTALAVQGFPTNQLSYHIQNALNIGIPEQEIIDIFIHISGYAGFPAANVALGVAREVFSERKKQAEKEKAGIETTTA